MKSYSPFLMLFVSYFLIGCVDGFVHNSKYVVLGSLQVSKTFRGLSPLQQPNFRITRYKAHNFVAAKLSSKSMAIERRDVFGIFGGSLITGFISLFPSESGAFATGEREIGEIPASGLIFKDTIKVTAFQDPKVEGVQLYISDFQRPITDRLKKDFFSDPSHASIACARVGTVRVSKDIYKGKDGEEVFEQARALLFKSLRVRR